MRPARHGISHLVQRVALATFAGLAPASHSLAQAAPRACRTDTTELVQHRLEYLKDLVSSQDTERVDMRRRLGIAAAPALVALVADESLCQRALAALNAGREKATRLRQIWLYDGGSCFAVQAPEFDALGSEGLLYLFDREFRRRSGVVGI